MKHGYMHMEGQRKGLGTSRNINVMVIFHRISADMIKVIKRFFMSSQLVHFLIHLLMLMHD